MLLRLIALFLLFPLIIGFTSSSNSTFIFEFSSSTASSDVLIHAAVSSLEQSGFRQVGSCTGTRCSNTGVGLQYGNHPIWVEVSSPSPMQLQFAFEQLHGGCGTGNPEVTGAKDVMTRVRAALESRFGLAIVDDTH